MENEQQTQQQQPYPYPVQQQQQQQQQPPQQPPWAPFYPPFYQNQHQQQPYPLHHPQPAQNPYFDPANAQLAQWAYQHMMFSQAQAQQRGTASAPASPADYFPPTQLFNPFPSGTPPPPQHHPHHPIPHQHAIHAPAYTQRTASADNPRIHYDGFHPYRRPQPGRVDGERWSGGTFQPPYARGDASASSTSVNSSSSSTGGGGGRQRTSSMQGNGSARAKGTPPTQQTNTTASNDGTSRVRKGSASGSSARPSSHASSSNAHPHHRTASSSSTASSSGTARPSVSSSTTATSAQSSSSHSHSHSHSHNHSHTHSNQQARPARPSPLSQGSTVARANSNASTNPNPNPSPAHTPAHLSIHTHSEKRMSRDDSDLVTMLEGTALGSAPTKAAGGLKGRLRRALSLGAAHALTEEDEQEDGGKSSSGTTTASPSAASPAHGSATDADASSTTPGGSTTTKKRSRAASLFNTRLNASTDNISLSSTMSSASVVIRKIGSIGKLARRNSLAGITSLFKDKNRDKDRDNDAGAGAGASTSAGDNGGGGDSGGGGKKKGKSKRSKESGSGKGAVVEPTISHAIAELDRSGSGGEWSDASMSGLSPAAKLVRQHTLRERARAEAEAQAQAQVQSQPQTQVNGTNGVNGVNGAHATDVPVPATWEKNTATGRDNAYVRRGVGAGEDGRVLVEDDSDSGSDTGHHTHTHSPPHARAHPQHQQGNYISEGWEDDEVWREEDEVDEDVTVRAPIGGLAGSAGGAVPGEDEEVVEWARTIRRTIEYTRPAKGILKGAGSYDQEVYIQDGTASPASAGFSRVRSNSYNSHPGTTSELGPLARIPSPDPDHIDGLHWHSHSSAHGGAGGNEPPPTLSSGSSSNSPTTPLSETDSGRSSPHHSSLFTLPNSSAPALSTMPTGPTSGSSTLPRASTSPATKRLVFANSLSVYDTFSSTVYDRRSEPATWSRLTPALAQRIKEELNSYKMEEMEVHVCSRMQCVSPFLPLHFLLLFLFPPHFPSPLRFVMGLELMI
ncbi:hypothetical protein V8B97DRAFT_1876439 [Scleroderma yunnanense]